MNNRTLTGSFALLLSFLFGTSHPVLPQEPRPHVRPRIEIITSVGAGRVFRFEDRGYGSHLNTGAGVEVSIWRGLRGGAEVNKTFGLMPSPTLCGAISSGPGQSALPCVGSAREGVASATAASLTAAYFFGARRAQPYIVGGISMLRTTEFQSTAIVRPDHVEFQEHSSTDTGFGPTIGIGLRASVTRRLSVRSELRLSDGTAMSGANLSILRISAGIGYGW